MPPKRAARPQRSAASKQQRRGLLGVPVPDSSEDEDFVLPGERKRRGGARQNERRATRGRAGSEVDTSDLTDKAAQPSSELSAGSHPDSDSSDSDEHGSYSTHSDSSEEGGGRGSGETLAARKQRLASQQHASTPQPPAPRSTTRAQRGAGARGSWGQPGSSSAAAAAAAAAAPPPVSRRGHAAGAAAGAAGADAHPGGRRDWQDLPAPILEKIFRAVCASGALPAAPRLASVCSSWAAVVDVTPELFSVLDTSRLPSSCTRACAGSSRAAKGASQQGTKQLQKTRAEMGLLRWLASGRLRQLRSVRLACPGFLQHQQPGEEGASGEAAGPSSPAAAAAAGGGVRNAGIQLNAELLMQLATGCPRLTSFTIAGSPGLKGAELSAIMLAMPALKEIRLVGVEVAGGGRLDETVRSVIEASGATGASPLTHVEIESCPFLTARAIKALVAPTIVQQQQQAQPQAAHGASSEPAAAGDGSLPAGQLQQPAAYPHLQVLTLTYSAIRAGGPVPLPLDLMQAAMPRLQELRVTGLGGIYGFHAAPAGARTAAAAAAPAALPGWPQLQVLHVGTFAEQCGTQKSGLSRYASAVGDTMLLQIAGRSPHLQELDVTGTRITPRGLLALATALAAVRAQQAPGEQQQQQGEHGLLAAAAAGAPPAAGGAVAQDPQASTAAAAAAAANAADARGGSDAEDDVEAQEEAAIAAAQGALRLRRLQVDASRLACDAGLHMLGRLSSDTLEQLVVRHSGAAVSDDGVHCLAACSRLQSLDLTGASVTDAGLSALLDALPAAAGDGGRGLQELVVASCRSLSRETRRVAMQGGVGQLRAHLLGSGTAAKRRRR